VANNQQDQRIELSIQLQPDESSSPKQTYFLKSPYSNAPFSNVSGTYPDSIYLPEDGAQRGNIVLNKGDQSTPGYPANGKILVYILPRLI
jgi:hypothetical protein